MAITAGRAGADIVKMVCLEALDAMPAHDWEINDARGEGIEILNSRGPMEINGQNRVTGLTVKRCLSVMDETGRFNLLFDESVKETISADTVIYAIGQGIEREIVERLNLKLNDQGTIKVDETAFEKRKGNFSELTMTITTAVSARNVCSVFILVSQRRYSMI